VSDIIFRPFDKQQEVLDCDARVKGVFAGKRGSKTELGAIQSVIWQESKPTNRSYDIDPFTGVIVAPTYDMLTRLSWKKFSAYARPFIKEQTKSPKHITWHDGSEIYGLSADRPERIEGMKIDWVWLDECFQVDEQTFLELQARVADTRGFMLLTGSLGVQYVNPKQHWAHKYFKEKANDGFRCFEWATADNPYFPQDEISRLETILDAETFKQMYTINWDSNSNNMVYSDFSSANLIRGYKVNPNLPVLVAVDWGWRHKMACLFAQYDQATDTVTVFDEIVRSRMTLDDLHREITSRGLQVSGYCCDISGNQEREMVGISNVQWFKDRGIKMVFRTSAVLYGVALVRSYVKAASGRVRLLIAEDTCKETVTAIKSYRYPESDGIAKAETPVKEEDDAVDALRYLFVNFIDKNVRDRHSRSIQL